MTKEEKIIDGVLHVYLHYTAEEKAAMKERAINAKAEMEAKKAEMEAKRIQHS